MVTKMAAKIDLNREIAILAKFKAFSDQFFKN